MNISKPDEDGRKCLKIATRCKFLDAVIVIPPEHGLPAKLFPYLGPNVISKEYTTRIINCKFISVISSLHNHQLLFSLIICFKDTVIETKYSIHIERATC